MVSLHCRHFDPCICGKNKKKTWHIKSKDERNKCTRLLRTEYIS